MTVKLHLIMPKKSPVSREVTTANYRECFSLITESGRNIVIKETIEQMLGKNYKQVHFKQFNFTE